LDNEYHREDAVKDIGALLEWIAKQSDLDKERVVVRGSSYGGYMVLSSLVHFGDKLCGGIDCVGISNFVTFLENTAEYRRNVRRQEYGDERDPQMRQFLLSISPITNASKIKKPLFVAAGANDPRVPLSESEQIVNKVRLHNVPVYFFIAQDEGHIFAKKTNVNLLWAAEIWFLRTLLLSTNMDKSSC